MTFLQRLHGDVNVKLQAVAILAVAGVVCLFELALFRLAIVPISQTSVEALLRSRLAVNPTGAMGTVQATLRWMAQRERIVVDDYNRKLVFTGVLVGLAPLLILLMLFLSSSSLRQASLKHALVDIGLTIVVLVSFQITFFMMGQRWAFSSAEHLLDVMVQQYHADAAADSDVVQRDPRVSSLYRGD